MYCVVTRNRHHHANYTLHLQQLHYSKVVIQRKIRQHRGMIGSPFHKLHAITARRQDIIWEIPHHQRPTPVLEHSHYKWDSPWPKPQRRHQQLISLTKTGSSWTHDQPSVPSETRVFSKPSNPVVQERSSDHTQIVDTKTMTTPHL